MASVSGARGGDGTSNAVVRDSTVKMYSIVGFENGRLEIATDKQMTPMGGTGKLTIAGHVRVKIVGVHSGPAVIVDRSSNTLQA